MWMRDHLAQSNKEGQSMYDKDKRATNTLCKRLPRLEQVIRHNNPYDTECCFWGDFITAFASINAAERAVRNSQAAMLAAAYYSALMAEDALHTTYEPTPVDNFVSILSSGEPGALTDINAAFLDIEETILGFDYDVRYVEGIEKIEEAVAFLLGECAEVV